MNNPHYNINSGEYQTDLKCTPLILDCDENANVICANCQTEISLVPNSSLTNLYNNISYIDQETINKNALRTIDIDILSNVKRRSLLPISKFALTDHLIHEDLTENIFQTPTDVTTIIDNKTEEMSCQTDLIITPHILHENEKAVITFCPSVSSTKIIPKLQKYLDEDNNEYKHAAEILTEIVHDTMTIPQRIFEPIFMKPMILKTSPSSCSHDNSEWDTVISEENSLQTQMKENSDDEICNMFDIVVDNSCKEDKLYCKSDDTVSIDSTVSEISSMSSVNFEANGLKDDLSNCSEIDENSAVVDNKSMKVIYIEDKINRSAIELSID